MGNETLYKLKKTEGSDSLQLEEVEEIISHESEKVRMSVSNKALIVSITAVVLYTILSFVLQFTIGIEPSPTLTECWYRFFTAEIFAIASIKVVKVFKNQDNNKHIFNKKEGVDE